MIVLILSMILIGLSVLERVIYAKKNKSLNKVRLLIDMLIICLLFSISYFITDTAIGIFYVFSSALTLIFIGIVDYRSDIEWLKYSAYIIGLPLFVFLLIKSTQNMLINPKYIFLLLSTINMILGYSNKRKWTAKQNIAFVMGIIIVAALMFSYYKVSDFKNRIMLKQELVAQKYLEEELGIYGLEVYVDNFNGSLRGEKVGVRAYDSSGDYMLMIYKDNKIISYDIKEMCFE